MAFKQINGARIYYQETGSGPETIVFSHGLLMSGEMFSEQVKALSGRYRCICYDHRGQSRSEVTDSGYEMDSLTEDAAALIRELDCAPCHFAGLSMGGFVGMRLAIRHPGLLKSLVLLETTADPEPEQNKGPLELSLEGQPIAGGDEEQSVVGFVLAGLFDRFHFGQIDHGRSAEDFLQSFFHIERRRIARKRAGWIGTRTSRSTGRAASTCRATGSGRKT